MNWGVGLDVGNTYCTAAIASPGTEPVIIEHASVLHHAPDGTIRLGEAETHSPGVRRFLDRITDNAAAPQQGTRGEELVATAMYCLMREIHEFTDQNVSVVAAIPPDFSPESVTALRTALDNMDLDYIELVPRAEAVDAFDPNSGMKIGEISARGAAALAAPEAGAGATNTVAPEVAAVPEVTAVPDDAAIAENPVPTNVAEAENLPSAETRSDRRPLVIAASAAGLLTAVGCAAALFIGHSPTPEVPVIRDATSPVNVEETEPENDPATVQEVPVQFPTVAPSTAATIPPPVHAPSPQPNFQRPPSSGPTINKTNDAPTEDDYVPNEGDVDNAPTDSTTETETPATETTEEGAPTTDPPDPGTTDPGTTDPGTPDPGTPDPGTSDPEPQLQLPPAAPAARLVMPPYLVIINLSL